MSIEAFKICTRCNSEKTHKIRRDGNVPGIIYGNHLESPIKIKLSLGTLSKLFKENTFGSIIPLELNGKRLLCIVKEIQRNNLGELIHVDFQNVSPSEIIKLKIPVNFVGIVTNMCVISNAVVFQSLYKNANIIVDGKLCSSFDSNLHNEALNVLEGLQIKVLR